MMRALVLAALACSATVGPAHANAAGPASAPSCGFTVFNHPLANERQVFVIDGTAVVIADGTDPRTGRMVCTLQSGERHSDPDALVARSLTTAGVVELPPTPGEVEPDDPFNFNVCAQVEIDGAGTFYWDALTDEWTTDSSVFCVDDSFHDPFVEYVDPVVCPVLGGDVYAADVLLWDCPPYGT
jgi:hypothetical protein